MQPVGVTDLTHTLTAGAPYRHLRTGFWLGPSVEHGRGTPIGHGGGDHEHAEGEADHAHAASSGTTRVPSHFTANVSLGVAVFRSGRRRPGLSLQIDVRNPSNDVYRLAREGEFSPAQFSLPRLISATAKVRF